MDIFRNVDNAYTTGNIVLFYIEKLISTVCWMSWISLNYATYFRHAQQIKHCSYFSPFSVFIYGKFNSNYYLYFLLFSGLYFVQVWFANYTSHFGPSYICGQCWYWRLFSSDIFWKMNFNFLSFLDVCFWPVNCTSQVCRS